ncbi:hypothetical protein Poras_0487 [Porphyromonas asaccharolytica DSM 20707]|uniref:Uncharacterized protein n=1 Tax=Porphyromonas asaccharolytica (strain ATCC 25260 / DSM 20707 / BCRC 10618 / CCUG 7834 / JCM 6326 / LMG 13178 / VPI 4198 / B440) TaxID=879243 RepID=F4KNH0_PORAD|nr:hypothetical protein Poras_0487 [Porphyromonas asaccharolytica DSM 20707]
MPHLHLHFASLTSSDLRPSRGVPTCVIIISTWEIENLHVDIFYSPRGDETIPPKFHLIPPKFYFSPTWRIFFLHVEIFDFSRGDRPVNRKCVQKLLL